MAVPLQQTLVQTALPLHMLTRLQRVRARYHRALTLAARGDYSESVALRSLARYVGHLMAREAKKPPAERGMRMVDLMLAVDNFMPELRGFTQHEVIHSRLRRLGPTG